MNTRIPIARVTKRAMSAMVFVLGIVTVGACVNQEPTVEDNLGISSQAAVTSHFVWNGQGASAFAGFDLQGISVNVWEDGLLNERHTFGDVWIYNADPTSMVCEQIEGSSYCHYSRVTYVFGWGELPGADVSFKNNSARVQATVANGPTFTIERCTVDDVAQTFDCTMGEGGELDVAWQKNSLYEGFSSGTNSTRIGVYTFRSQGTSSSVSADSSGTVFGVRFGGTGEPHGDGYIGSGRNVVMDIMKDPRGLKPK
jgi:hypothetical protein